MAHQVLRSIILGVKNSSFSYFSLIVDETKDVSTKEQVSICLRSVSVDLFPVGVSFGGVGSGLVGFERCRFGSSRVG
jgi:hypothetical protein